ncbi:MAG TPA: hypothetical protein VN494_08555 [Patescibacteria group bacterium]|nr:hypothetical protein [Patescibacteria group bacterium]
MGKKSWAWDKMYLDDRPLEGDAFIEGLFQWMDSPEGELSEEARETVWPLLETTQVDATCGKLIWPDGKRLDINQTVRRIHTEYPQLGRELIEDKVISWLEMGYVPQDYSPTQSDELERLIDRWLKNHYRRSRRSSSE